MAQGTFLGIDFSGGAAAWRTRCSRPTVWIATLDTAVRPRLVDVAPVQALSGQGDPFSRMVNLLQAGVYAAAGIDAPFCVPARHMPPDGHAALLAAVAKLPDGLDRPFPTGAALVGLAAGIAPLETAKPLRETEKNWSARGVNTRSTLWNGPRGGAPFTAACLTLLARAKRPVWPWSTGSGLLVESFPAAQLKAWGLPYTGYAASDQRAARDIILGGLRERLDINPKQATLLLDCSDALDAVLAAFGAIAAATQDVPPVIPRDGLISVMDAPVPAASTAEARKAAPARGSKPAPPVGEEGFESLLDQPSIRIERIVSRGHVTPGDQPYEQNHDEWVMVIEGSAKLEMADRGVVELLAGDHLLIPAGVSHLVTYTADPTVWIAVHLASASQIGTVPPTSRKSYPDCESDSGKRPNAAERPRLGLEPATTERF